MPYAVNDVLEQRNVVLYTPQISVNVLHAKVVGQVGLGATEQEISDALSTTWAPIYKAAMAAAATYYGLGVKRINPLPVSFETTSLVGQGVGLAAGDPLPKQLAGLATLISDTPGRRGRGRMYIPFASEAQNDNNGTPTAGYMGLLNAFCVAWTQIQVINSLFNPGASTTIRYGIWSKASQAFRLAANAICRDAWATQRRRGDFGRVNILPF